MSTHALREIFEEVREAAVKAARHTQIGMHATFKNQSLRMKKIRKEFQRTDREAKQLVSQYNAKHRPKGERSAKEQYRDIPLFKQGASKSYLRKHPELEGKEKFLTIVERGTLGFQGALFDPMLLKTVVQSTAVKIGKTVVPPEVLLQAIYLEFSQAGVETGSGVDGQQVNLDALMTYEEFRDRVMEEKK